MMSMDGPSSGTYDREGMAWRVVASAVGSRSEGAVRGCTMHGKKKKEEEEDGKTWGNDGDNATNFCQGWKNGECERV